MDNELTVRQRNILFWASFLALMAPGVGFGIRVMSITSWTDEFAISNAEAGSLFGASLWPIAVGMILFSMVVDKIGYKASMLIAFSSLVISSIWTIFSNDLQTLTLSFLIGAFGHGVVEACINPLCATMYKSQKSKMLNILHASWPAGIVVGASLALTLTTGENATLGWRDMFWFALIPILAFGVMFIISHKYPQDERVEANISYADMFREFGGLGIFLAVTFLFYEIVGQLIGYGIIADPGAALTVNRIYTSLIVGAVVGLASGVALKSAGKILFFILCIIMIPLATAEIATDGWIQKLMKPVIEREYGFNSGWAIVLSSLIMMTLRFFAGVPLKYLSPPAVLMLSSVFSIIGLLLLSGASGLLIFLAFVLYGIGQTFYWPTVLGFTAEQFPKGGAMTLNTVSAMGLLTVGIFGMPFLGAVGDNFDAQIVKEKQPIVYEAQKAPANFFFWKYEKVDIKGVKADLDFPDNVKDQTDEQAQFASDVDQNGRKVLKVAAVLPAIMGVAFLFIIFFYKSRGGYKPIVLESSWE